MLSSFAILLKKDEKWDDQRAKGFKQGIVNCPQKKKKKLQAKEVAYYMCLHICFVFDSRSYITLVMELS